MSVLVDYVWDNNGQRTNIRPLSTELVKVKQAGNITEVTYTSRRSKGGTTKKISKSEYIDLRDGEVKEFNHQERRSDDLKSVSRSMKQGRDMINANVINPAEWRWITLTYAQNVTDQKKVYNDFKNFLRKLKPFYDFNRYIICIEPQRRGAWHIHLLLGFPTEAPFIPNDILARTWGHGFVRVMKLDNVDNVGAYLTAYLADVPLDEVKPEDVGRACTVKEVDTLDENGKHVKKRVLKGARLSMYPAGMHIFRWSRNCKKPSVKLCTAQTAEKIIDGQTLTYESTKRITDTATGFESIINYRVYNSRRKETDEVQRVYHRVARNPKAADKGFDLRERIRIHVSANRSILREC